MTNASKPNIEPESALKRTALYEAHHECGAKLVPFAGYEMPVQYPLGVMKEHLWTRDKAGLFDVSHMGQLILKANDGQHETVAAALETLVPADIIGLEPGRQRYSQLLNDNGGIIDDLMIARLPHASTTSGTLMLIVNAARKHIDADHIARRLPPGVQVTAHEKPRALIAVQGPKAIEVLGASDTSFQQPLERFMDVATGTIGGAECVLTRSGYTGEDGVEISCAEQDATIVWSTLIANPDVMPIGLGARDSLRLEAGLCLYGSDIDTATSPIEASLAWSVPKVRRPGGARAGDYPGVDTVARHLTDGPTKRRVGLKPEGRAPIRGGAQLYIDEESAAPIGTVTSGGFGPSVGSPVAMGYAPLTQTIEGTRLFADVRGKRLPVVVSPLAHITRTYKR